MTGMLCIVWITTETVTAQVWTQFEMNRKDAINIKTKRKVDSGISVLKPTGDGISTIHARKVNFVDAAALKT